MTRNPFAGFAEFAESIELSVDICLAQRLITSQLKFTHNPQLIDQ